MTTETFHRTLTIPKENDRGIDQEQRTVEVAFSSEAPVERWYGDEILDHADGSIRLGRLENGAAALRDHDPTKHIGVVERVSIDADKKGRATLRISRNAEELWTDILDGVVRHISVGYRVHKWFVESRDEDTDHEVIRITDWEPVEISFVSIPADVEAGVNRGIDRDQNRDDESEPAEEPTPQPSTKPDNGVRTMPEPTELEQYRKDERLRVQAIREMAKKYEMTDEGDEAIHSDMPVDEFRAKVLETVNQRQVEKSTEMALDLDKKDLKRYSLTKAIRAAQKDDWDGAEFELECSVELEKKTKQEARGFLLPLDIVARSVPLMPGSQMQRDTMATGAGAGLVDGGAVVPTEHMPSMFIDSLRARAVLGRLGVTYLPGLMGDLDIPRKQSDGNHYWLGEDEDVTDTDFSLGNLMLSPKTIAQSIAMTRKLLKQSSPAIDALVLSDILDGISLGIDLAGLEGDGTGNMPLGIAASTGVNVQPIAASATTGIPTHSELVGFETRVDTDMALEGSLSYLTTPGIYGGLKTTPIDAGSGRFLLEGTEANGYTVNKSHQLPAQRITFGNWSDLLIALWGTLDIKPDPYTKAKSDGLVIRAFQDVDMAVRHGSSFCING